jgi:hypothetical protein
MMCESCLQGKVDMDAVPCTMINPAPAPAVFTEEGGFCSNAANAFKTAGMTLSGCEQLCETTPGCFDGFFCETTCGNSNWNSQDSNRGMVCNLFGSGIGSTDDACGTVMPYAGQTKFTMTRYDTSTDPVTAPATLTLAAGW